MNVDDLVFSFYYFFRRNVQLQCKFSRMQHFMFVWLNLFSNLFQAQTHECRGKREKWIVVQLFPV